MGAADGCQRLFAKFLRNWRAAVAPNAPRVHWDDRKQAARGGFVPAPNIFWARPARPGQWDGQRWLRLKTALSSAKW